MNNITKAIATLVASFLLVGFSSEMKSPTVSMLSTIAFGGAASYLTKKTQLSKWFQHTPVQTQTAPVKHKAPIKVNKIESPQNPPSETWKAICQQTKDPESVLGVIKQSLLEPNGLWNEQALSINENIPLDIEGVCDGTVFQKGARVPADLQLLIAYGQPIEWKKAAKWVKGTKFLGLKTALDSKGYKYSPHIKITLPKEGEGYVVCISISFGGQFTQ